MIPPTYPIRRMTPPASLLNCYLGRLTALSLYVFTSSLPYPGVAPRHEVPDKPDVFKNIDHHSVDLNHDLTYLERPVKLIDEDVRLTRRRKIKFYKVQWTNHSEEEATWEREDYLRKELPELFSTQA